MAAISKEAKEQIAQELLEMKRAQEGWNVNWGFAFGAVGTSVAVGSLYYAYKRDNREQLEERREEPVADQFVSNLESLD